jgi:hypothetical protein
LNDGFVFPSGPSPAPAGNPAITFFPSSDAPSSPVGNGFLHPTEFIPSTPDIGHVADVNSFGPPHLASDFHII